MSIIPQRLSKIFAIILESEEPVSVATLSKDLDVSRRTIFRELENVDNILKKMNLQLETTVGEGLYLKGSKADKDKLVEMIKIQRESLAANKDSRRIALALLLLDSTQWEKLYYFSSVLEVSESTVSLDMDILKQEFKSYNVQLLRKKGMGVFVNGTELNIRTAFVNYLLKAQNIPVLTTMKGNILSTTIAKGVEQIINEQSIFLNWMTQDALAILSYRLIVQISRLKNGMTLNISEIKKQNTLYTEVAKNLVQEISYHFDIEIIDQELDYIVDGLRAARTKTGSEFYEDESVSFTRAQSLAYKMIECFDSRLAPTLKMNEDLVRGLSIHLWSAVVRIESGYSIKDPLGGQLKREYPDIYHGAEKACVVLSDELGKPISEEEVSCVATHFGAAVMQIGVNKLKRRLKVSIICHGGIGVSYMMAGQVKKIFGKDVITEVGIYNQPYSWKDSDFLIATTEIADTDKPVIIAHPILTPSEIGEINTQIELLASAGYSENQQQKDVGFSEKLGKIIVHMQNIDNILNNFGIITIQDQISIDELCKFVSYRFADTVADGEKILNDLISREQIATQLIEQLDIVLLHCCTDGVKKPLIMLLHPNGGYIQNAKGAKANSCLLMLLPQNASTDLKEAVGALSGSLVEDEQLLDAILAGDEKVAYKKLEVVFSAHLAEYYKDLFGE